MPNPERVYPKIETEFFTPSGGLDQVTPRLRLLPGFATDALNFEVDIDGGYRRIAGIDKWTPGTPPPSAMTYYTGTFSSNFVASFIYYLIGQVSGSTAILVWAVNSPSGVVATLANVQGGFVLGESVHLIDGNGAVQVADAGTVLQVPIPVSGATAKLQAEAILAAQALRRLQVCPVGWTQPDMTGVAPYGPILGVFELNDEVYAFRRSGVGAVTKLYVRTSLIIPETVLNLQWSEAPTFGSNTIPSITISLPEDPTAVKFETVTWNFYGSLRKRAYVVTGVSKAFWYDDTDGSTLGFHEITSPLGDSSLPDTPQHICVHRNRLFLSYKGVVMFSNAGVPDDFTAGELLGGSFEVGDDDVTGMVSIRSDPQNPALLVTTRRSTYIYYGEPASGNDQLLLYDSSVGGYAYTAQVVDQPIFASAFGVTKLAPAQTFGSFESATITHNIKKYMEERRGKAIGSVVVRSRNQYRIFFKDRSSLFITFANGKVAGTMPIRFDITPVCFWSSTLSDGTEQVLIGAEDGFIYQMDVGNSFAGNPIDFNLALAFNHQKAPRTRKTYKRVTLEVTGEGYAEFDYGYDLSYGTPDISGAPDRTVGDAVDPIGGRWDDATWDFGHWDGGDVAPIVIDSPGNGTNFSVRLRGHSALCAPFILSGVITHYIPRRLER